VRAAVVSGLIEPEPEPKVLSIRHMRESEHSLVLDSWLKQYSYSSFARRCGAKYWERQEAIAKWCMRRGAVLVATHEETPDVALGWICGQREPQVIDFVYVKHVARRLGVASGLVLGLFDQPWREAKARMTHKPGRTHIQDMANAAGWVFAPVRPEELET
jgi:hypothetical protein